MSQRIHFEYFYYEAIRKLVFSRTPLYNTLIPDKEHAMPEKNVKNIKIHLPEGDRVVHYSNIAIISHSPEEVVLDFAQTLPGKEEAEVVSRIIMTPRNAKMLLQALENNIKTYEDNFGPLLPNPKDSHIH